MTHILVRCVHNLICGLHFPVALVVGCFGFAPYVCLVCFLVLPLVFGWFAAWQLFRPPEYSAQGAEGPYDRGVSMCVSLSLFCICVFLCWWHSQFLVSYFKYESENHFCVYPFLVSLTVCWCSDADFETHVHVFLLRPIPSNILLRILIWLGEKAPLCLCVPCVLIFRCRLWNTWGPRAPVAASWPRLVTGLHTPESKLYPQKIQHTLVERTPESKLELYPQKIQHHFTYQRLRCIRTSLNINMT